MSVAKFAELVYTKGICGPTRSNISICTCNLDLGFPGGRCTMFVQGGIVDERREYQLGPSFRRPLVNRSAAGLLTDAHTYSVLVHVHENHHKSFAGASL